MTNTAWWQKIGDMLALALVFLGVDATSLFYALTGSAFGVLNDKKVGRWSALSFIALSSLLGAVAGKVVIELLGIDSRAQLSGACALCGFGMRWFMPALRDYFVAKMYGNGGQS